MDAGSIFRRIVSDTGFCLVFFTRFPLPHIDTGTRTLGDAIWAAPIAGIAIGLAGGLAYAAAASLGLSFLIAAALAIAATMLASGCLHEDGLSDVADGFGGGTSRERKLEIMRDSRIGTYGTLALVMSALIRWSAISSLVIPSLVFWSLIAAHAASRALLPAFMALLPHARADGLGAGAGDVPKEGIWAALAIGLAVLLIALGPWATVITALCLALLVFGFRALCLRQIGGQTGDTLGALQQMAEIVVLIIATSALY